MKLKELRQNILDNFEYLRSIIEDQNLSECDHQIAKNHLSLELDFVDAIGLVEAGIITDKEAFYYNQIIEARD